MERDHRVPVSIVHYRRAVYVARDPNQPKTRLTMDAAVCAAMPADAKDLWAAPTVDLLPPDHMVLELKFDGDRPGWMRELCRCFCLRAIAVSKFGLSVVHLHRPDYRHAIRFLTPRPFKQALGQRPTFPQRSDLPSLELPLDSAEGHGAPLPGLPGLALEAPAPGVVDP